MKLWRKQEFHTFAKLAKTNAAKISEIIADVRGNHVTDTWPAQAKLAADGKWDELKEMARRIRRWESLIAAST